MRPEKQAMVREIREEMEKSKFVILADCRGLRADQMTDLRAKLRAEKSYLKVTKNSFLGKAANELGQNEIAKLLKGPTAMITGAGDVTIAAKILKAFADDNKLPVLKGGMLEGKLYLRADVDALAMLPAREILLGMFVRTVAAPMTGLIGVMNQKVLSLLYVLKAIEEKKTSGKSS